MGALATAFTNRYSSQVAIALTNSDTESATTVNTTLLSYAETDASNEFYFRTGIAFDSTSTYHITLGVKGVLATLYKYRGLPKNAAADSAQSDWDNSLNAFNRSIGNLAWQSPQTTSNLQPSPDPTDPVGALPYFDRRSGIMNSLVPPPVGGNADLDPGLGR